jgi:hypothetical protein
MHLDEEAPDGATDLDSDADKEYVICWKQIMGCYCMVTLTLINSSA